MAAKRLVDHDQYRKRRSLLQDRGYAISKLNRWVMDYVIVRLVVSGSVTLEELDEKGIDFDAVLENTREQDLQELWAV